MNNSPKGLTYLPEAFQTMDSIQAETEVPFNPSMANPINVPDVFENGQKGLA